MRKLFLALAISTALATTAVAWPLDQMNRSIEQTNFIVGKGCSGTLISLSERYILTNYHCIDDSVSTAEREAVGKDGTVRKLRVRRYVDVPVGQNGYDGFTRVSSTSFVAEIVAEDKKVDLALLKIKGPIPNTYASPLLPDSATITRGERIYIVGNPAGAENTVVEGIVSNMNRTFEFPWTGDEKLPMIQFSGGIFGGNSGGALYNEKGELIGVPGAMVTGANFIGLAVPITIVKTFLTTNCALTNGKVSANSECIIARQKAIREKEAAE
jgi:S1-C subfamily serine protease